jgi:sugar phosphate isomerase/epimerase
MTMRESTRRSTVYFSPELHRAFLIKAAHTQCDLHLAPGEGAVDWAMVKRLLAGFRGVAMYEIEPGEFDPLERLATTMAAHRRYLA